MYVHTDASGRCIGSVLNVFRDGETLSVAFYSQQLRGAETRYSATELEALAVAASVQHFVRYLYCCNFVVTTGHQLLMALLSLKVLNRHFCRELVCKLLEFDVNNSGKVVWLRDRGTGNKIPALRVDSGGSTTRTGIYTTFLPYLMVTFGELRSTDSHRPLSLCP